MMDNPVASKTPVSLGREGKITALRLLKNFYDEEIFTLLVREFYNSDIGVSEAAINASGSLGNEVAIPHLYQIIERGKTTQRIAAIKALAVIRAPSSVPMLVKYFNHFPEEEVRSEILRAANIIAPSGMQVLDLDQAVYSDSKQSEGVRQVAAESLVDAGKLPLLKESLPSASAGVQEATLRKMLNSASQEVFDFDLDALSPIAIGIYLCLHTMKAKNPQANYVLDALQRTSRHTIYSFLQSLSQYQGRLRFPTRVFRLLLAGPYVDAETEAMVGDFLKKVVAEVRIAAPHLLSEFSVVAAAHLDNAFAKVHRDYISLRGISHKTMLLAAVFATLMEKYASSSVLTEVVSFFKDEATTGRTSPIAQVRKRLSGAPKEDANRFEACVPLFGFTERKDRMLVLAQLAKVDLDRPFLLRKLNRLIRVAGALEIRSASKRIQDILDFARAERIHFLEETSIVTLCQLLTRTIIEKSREYFREPGKNARSLNGYIRGARFIPPRIMAGPLVDVLLAQSLNAQSRALAVESLESMDKKLVAQRRVGFGDSKKLLFPLLKIFDMKDVDDALKLRVADLVCRNADPSIAHQAVDLTMHASASGKKAGIRLLKVIGMRAETGSADVVIDRLYKLLENSDPGVRVEALVTLLAIGDDYASQVLKDLIEAGEEQAVAGVLAAISRPISREAFAFALDSIRMESVTVQEALRSLLPDLSQGGFAEEMRQRLVAALMVVPGESTRPDAAAPAAPSAPPVGSALGQNKFEFKFRRENTQVLTVLFVDIAGYTEKSATVEMSTLLKVIKSFEEIVTSTISAHRGLIVKKMGDGILAVFKHPLNAAVAALEVQKKIREYSLVRVEEEKFQARIGLNTGPVIRRDNDVFGEVVNIAARMQAVAEREEVVLTETTYEEVRDYVRCTDGGKIQVKGIKDPIMAYYAKEITVDVGALTARPSAEKGTSPVRDVQVERLRESVFVPDFRLPGDQGGDRGALVSQLRAVFADLSRAVEDVSADYREEYAFKKYLEDRWNALVESLQRAHPEPDAERESNGGTPAGV